MQVVNCRFDIMCKDKDNIEIKMFCHDYSESVDEIKIKTQVNTTNLKRGWMGDLHYICSDNREITNGDKSVDVEISNSYKDVLLKSVNVCSIDNGVTTWEYTFLKK